MSEGPREIEAKFRVADRPELEARLAALGAVPGAREDEVNLLLDDDDASLRSRGCALRVRTVGGRGLLTYKGPASFDGGVKARLELESGVDAPESLLPLLDALGFRPRFRYDKRRTPWRFVDAARPLVVVDETPLGLFAEIEGEAAAVRTLAAELGVAEESFLRASYQGLWQAAREAEPDLPEDMVFPE
ncbi:MAG TPA: class IV adenylate cyclase [Thermoanaerobaculia bacterium]|nr:class IV adenylate cyclase [Thermoanaerobaculia bacterium]